MQFNPNTYMAEWHDGSSVPLEYFDSLFEANDKMPLLSFFHLQDVRKERLRQNEEKPA